MSFSNGAQPEVVSGSSISVGSRPDFFDAAHPGLEASPLDLFYSEARAELVDAAVQTQLGVRWPIETRRARAAVTGYAFIVGKCVEEGLPFEASESEMTDELNGVSSSIEHEIEALYADIHQTGIDVSRNRKLSEYIRASNPARRISQVGMIAVAAGSAKVALVTYGVVEGSISKFIAGAGVVTAGFMGRNAIAAVVRNKTHRTLGHSFEAYSKPVPDHIKREVSRKEDELRSQRGSRISANQRMGLIKNAEIENEGDFFYDDLMHSIGRWLNQRHRAKNDQLVSRSEAGDLVAEAITRQMSRSLQLSSNN